MASLRPVRVMLPVWKPLPLLHVKEEVAKKKTPVRQPSFLFSVGVELSAFRENTELNCGTIYDYYLRRNIVFYSIALRLCIVMFESS